MCWRCSTASSSTPLPKLSWSSLRANAAKRIEERAKRTRNVALQIIEALACRSLERPVYTASITYPRKPLVTDSRRSPGRVRAPSA